MNLIMVSKLKMQRKTKIEHLFKRFETPNAIYSNPVVANNQLIPILILQMLNFLKMRYSIFVCFAFMIVLMISCTTNETGTEPRTRENFGTGWEFTRDTNTTVWEKVNLPHTARIEPLVITDQWKV